MSNAKRQTHEFEKLTEFDRATRKLVSVPKEQTAKRKKKARD